MKLDFEPLFHFFEHLPKSGDEEMSVLKSHLLVEELLNKLIEQGVKHPKYLKTARLSFTQKISLSRSLSPHFLAEQTWIWGAIKKLNAIRNKLAHGLSSDKATALLNDYISFVKKHNENFSKIPVTKKFGRVHIANFFVFTYLSGFVNADYIN